MRFLGIGDYLSLGDMYLRLQRAGHDVRVCTRKPEGADIFAGMLERHDDWRDQIEWVRAAGDDGVILFESAEDGELADALRRDGLHVVGGSAFGDRLETDRAFGQEVMRESGMQTAPVHAFSEFDAAIAFVRANPARYVYKRSDAQADSTRTYVGARTDGADLLALLQRERARGGEARFVLMQHLSGIEVGIGAYFDGERFLEPACIDWEHKHFFPGNLGELTGEMGTVVSYRGAEPLFDATLARIEPRLRAAGHCGYLNINTIVDEHGVWPLEFTSRFGYPGFAICDALHDDGWDAIFARMVHRQGGRFATRDGFAVGVVLTVPPFPYEYGYAELSKGAPVLLRDDVAPDDLRHLHFGEVGLADMQLVCTGSIGYIMVVTGTGDDIRDAQRDAYDRVAKVTIANMRYRNDIGDRLRDRDLPRLRTLGWYR